MGMPTETTIKIPEYTSETIWLMAGKDREKHVNGSSGGSRGVPGEPRSPIILAKKRRNDRRKKSRQGK